MRGDPEFHQFIGTKTYLLDVDPLHDFIGEDGLFERVYGQKDIEPLRKVQETIATIVRTYHMQMFCVALVASKYRKGQFNHRDPRLETLCTTAEGRKLILPEGLQTNFHRTLKKTRNSVLSTQGFAMELQKGSHIKNLWLTGITTTSCIDAAIDECRDEATQHIRIIIAKDAVASRRSRRRDEHELFEKWSDLRVENLYVFDSWRDVPIVSEPTIV